MFRDTGCYGVNVKMISLMLSDTDLNALLMTSGPDQTLSQHTFSHAILLVIFILSFLKIKTQLQHGKKTARYFHLLIWWHCISQKWLHYEFSLTLLSLCLHIRADRASPTHLKWTQISHKC